MPEKLLFFVLIIFPCLAHSQYEYRWGTCTIKGNIRNFTEPVFDIGLSTYLGSFDTSVTVNPDGSFDQAFPVQHRQDLLLAFGNQLISITVEDKDIITVDCDYNNLPNTILIKSNNKSRTKELQLQARTFIYFFNPFLKLREKLNRDTLKAEAKYLLVNNLYKQNVASVLRADSAVSESTNRLMTGLYFQYTNLLREQNLIPRYQLQLPSDNTENLHHMNVEVSKFGYTMLNEDWFWNVLEYRRFIYDYLRFTKPFSIYEISHPSGLTFNKPNPNYVSPPEPNIKPFNPTLDEYYTALSDISLINIRDWFITKSVIDGFGNYSFSDVEKVYRMANKIIVSSYLEDTLQSYYNAVVRLKPGNLAPAFVLQNEWGKAISLNDFKGRVVYIDFWGVTCGPCLLDIKKYVPKLHEHYKNQDVAFINICVDSNISDWKNALDKYKLSGVNLIAEGWADHPVCKNYNVTGIPHYVLIDKNGRIADNNAPLAWELNLEGNNEIDSLLK